MVATTPVETLALRREAFERLRVAHPAVEHMLVTILTAHARRLSAGLTEALYCRPRSEYSSVSPTSATSSGAAAREP